MRQCSRPGAIGSFYLALLMDLRRMPFARWSLAAGYGCLAVTIGFLLVRPSSRVAQPADLITAALDDAASSRAGSTIVLLLNPQDCAERIEALTAWNALHRSGQARVLGLVSDAPADPAALETIRDGAGIQYPLTTIRHDRMVAALHGLNYSSTPVALILDSRRRLRIAVPLYERDAGGLARAAMLQVEALQVSSHQADER